jgi:polar amino acid transport system substrate-binding protein
LIGTYQMVRHVLHLVFALSLATALSPPARAESTLDKIKREGIIKICTPQVVPDLYKDPKTGEWLGVMADLANTLAAWMKVKVQPVEVGGFDAAVLTLKQGNCDLIGSSMVYNAPRAMEVNFIRPFGAKGINAVIAKMNKKGLKAPADLNSPDITIITSLGSREHEAAARLFPKAKLIAVKVPAAVQIVEHVKRGDADVALLPTITVKWWLQVPENAEWGTMAFPGQDFGNAPNGWAIRYGDPDWKDFLDNYSNYVAANNIATKLYEDYMERSNPYKKPQQ